MRSTLTVLAGLTLIGSACSHARAASSPAPVRSTRGMSDEALLRDKSLMVPVAGVGPSMLRDTYAATRGSAQVHEALDILAPRGTAVVATDDGRVLRLRHNEAGGITIYQVDSDERFVYYYAHLERYRAGLGEGARVRRGEIIGYVGTTGNAPANAPHLHFQLMRYRGNGQYSGGEPLDPKPFLVRPGQAR